MSENFIIFIVLFYRDIFKHGVCGHNVDPEAGMHPFQILCLRDFQHLWLLAMCLTQHYWA